MFVFHDGKPLTRAKFVAKVREKLAGVGVDYKKYSGHSFRSGAATTVSSKAGHFSDSTIKMLGRWKNSAYQLYIRTLKDQLAAISQKLVRH